MSSRPNPRQLTKLQWCADLFRDDTTLRLAIINGLLILIAGAAAIVLLSN
jgi:hypothetical protein